MKYIGSNYTISRSIKLGVNLLISKLGQGVFLAASRIGTGSGFEHAGGTPYPFWRVPEQVYNIVIYLVI